MKTLSLRLRGMKGELEELGEESEGVENISKMQGQILNMTKGRVNIFDDAGNFKSTYDIMKGIAEVYDDLSSTDQADLLETIAGKNRANDVAALISNFDTAIKMVDTAENSFGSAAGENEKYLDSLQGRLDVLQASFQAMSNSAIDDGLLKNGVSLVTRLVDAFTKLIDTIGIVPTLFTLIGGGLKLFGKNAISIDKASKSISVFGKELRAISNIAFNKNGSLFDNLFSSDFDKLPQQIEQNEKLLKQYYDTKNKTYDNDDVKNQKLNSILNEMSPAYKEAAASEATFEAAQQAGAAAAQAEAMALNTKSTSLRAQISLLREYNSAAKTGGVSKNLGKTAQQIQEEIQGTNIGGTIVGGLVSSATDAATGKAVQVSTGKAIGSIIKGAAGTAIKGAAGFVGSMFMGAIGGILISGLTDLLMNGIGWFFDNVINRAETLSKSVDEMNQKFGETKTTLSSARKTISDVGDSYAKLSSGVNTKTNENLNLSTEDYEEYLNITNQIAGQFPELVSGYDAQGNAILTCAGNVEALNEAYNTQAIEAYNETLKESSTVMEDFNNKKKEIENGTGDLAIDEKQYEHLKDALGNDSGKSIDEALKGLSDYATIAKALEDAGAEKKDGGFLGIGGESNLDFIKRVIRESPDIANEVVSQFEDSMATASEGMKSIAEAYIGKAFAEGDYSGISDGMQSVLSSVISEFDYDFYSQFDSIDAMEQQLDDMLSSFNSLNDGDKNKLELAFNLETQLNNGEISVDEYLANIKDIGSIIDGMNIDENAKQALRLSFDIDENDIEQKYNDLIDKLTQSGINESEAISWVGSLNGTDLNMAMSLDFTGKDSIEDIQEALDLTKALQGVGTIDIQVETEAFEKLNTAISESNGAAGLTQDSIDAISNRYANLEGFDPAAIFEKTTTGVRLNTRALNEMETQLISVNKAANAKNLSVLAKQAKELEESIDAANRAGEDTSGFEAQLETVRESIQDAQMAAAAYDGLTSAYKGWIDAQSAGQEGDMYASIQEGIEGMQELANEGRWGNTQLQEFIKMFSAEGSMDTATPQQFADSWGSAITKANRYFTEGTQGLDNFFKDVADRTDELVYMDESGSWQIKPGVEIEDFAREMEVANSTVEAIFGNANEYGANFEIGIEQQSLDELISESEKAAQEASDALKSTLGEDFEISYNLKVNEDGTNNAQEELEKLKTKRDEINNSDATVEVKQQGIDAVNAQIESLIREKVQLEQPTFMTLNASQVNASLVDALGKVQEMQSAMNELTTLNQMQEAGIQIDTSDIDAAQQRVDECAQAIQGLDGDVKIAIGLEEDGSIDSIKSSFADGKVNIPIGAESEGVKSATEEVQKRLETIKDKNVTLTINVDGDVDAFEKASEGAKNLDGVKSNAVIMTAKLDSNLDGKDAQIDNLNEFADAAKNLDGVSSSTVHLNAYLDSDIWGNDKKGQLENLPKFAEAAKELQGLDESTTVRLNAYFDSNVWGNDKSAQLENLDTFCDAVKQLQGIDESTTVRLTAYLDSNLWGDDKSAQLKNIDTFVDAATKLKDMGGEITTNIKAYFDSNVWGDDKTSQLSNMEDFTKAAQELQGIGDATVHLSAYLDSNLWGDDKSAQLDNINAFSEAAQMLNGIGDVTVHLNAYLDSNVWGTDKSVQLSNIDSFADAAQKLQGIGDTTVHLNAYLDSNVWGSDKAAQLGNLDAFADIANRLNGISDVNVSVNANISNAPEQSETDKLMTFSSVVNQLQGVSNVNVSVGANVDTAAIDSVRTSLQGLSNSGVMHDYTANITVNANTSAIDAIKSSIASIQTRVVAVTATANGAQAVNALKASIDAVTAKTVDVTANVSGTDEVNALTKAIKALTGKVVSVTAKVSGTSAVNALRNAISGVQSKTVNITTYRTTVNRTTTGQGTVATGTATPKGAAFAYGTEGKSFKRGDWGIKSDGVALGGELGPELLVRDGKYRLIGENSAEFFQHKRGDIVFNAEQTREIFEKGRITGLNTRGQAFANGTFPTQGNAYASVTGGWKPGGIKPSGSSGTTVVNNTTNNYNYNTSKSSSNKSSSSAKKAADEFKESLDWIEIAIDRVERAIDSLDKTATNTFLDFAERDGALLQQMQQVTNEINLQQQAYERYMAEANSVGLSADWQDKIKNGRIDIEVITDEGLKEQIDQFQEWYFIMPIYLVMNI